jgi:glycosyltransferase involved in cell wall biosynthesis
VSDLVVVSLEAWDGVWRRNQHLVAGLLRADPDLRVLFVEPSSDPLHAVLCGRRPRLGRGLRPAPSGAVPGVPRGTERLWLHEPSKLLPRTVDRLADVRWAAAVQRSAARAGFGDPLLWVNSPQGAHLLDRTGWLAVYDITDDWLAADRPTGELARLRAEETILLERCAEVIVCSPGLAGTKPHPRLTLIPNAVDAEAYQHPHARPADLPTGDVVMYVGTTHADRTDVPLLAATARALRGCAHVVLVGPVLLEERTRQTLRDAGVVMLGPREHDLVPAYLQHARVLVVPHVVNTFTDSLDPIKVYEYRAAARPVVSTPVAGFRDTHDPWVVTVDRDDFVDVVRQRVAATGHELPSRSAWSPDLPTWEMRVREVQAVLARLEREV